MNKYLAMVNNKRAQIVLPSVFILLSVFLVIYLIFETTKISREKIRHQFALDTSAFVEMTSSSHNLNATAYLNGTFPFRLFREMFESSKKSIKADGGGGGSNVSLYDYFYYGGAFPAMDNSESSPKLSDEIWDLHFFTGGNNNPRSSWNQEQPTVDQAQYFPITSEDIATGYEAYWDTNALRNYLITYYFLSQSYEDQKKVYQRIGGNGEFFRKGYYRNVGNCKISECGKEGAVEFKGYNINTTPVYIKKIVIYYKDPGDGGVKPIKLDMEEDKLFDGQLFQFAYVDRNYRDKLKKLYTGLEINQSFPAPENYFGVNLNKYKPHTHVRVALQCPRDDNNCVWPKPTPKYQVRLYP